MDRPPGVRILAIREPRSNHAKTGGTSEKLIPEQFPPPLPCVSLGVDGVSAAKTLPASGEPPASTRDAENNAHCQRVG